MSSDLVMNLLNKRGIVEPEQQERFLRPDFVRDTHDPLLLHDMEKAVLRILSAIAGKEKVVVYADFDCDGIPGAALMSDFFRKIGHTNLEIYIPHRDREGHGFHFGAVEKFAASDVALIITIDCGIGAIETTMRAKELGIDVIITDHHEVTNGLPPAYAVVNPKLDPYPFKDLCGAAVAWKLVSALLTEGRKRVLPQFIDIPEGWEKWLLDLAAISTVADLVPLVGENRVLAHFGLKVLRKSPRKGLKALCSVARVRQFDIAEDDIGFSFAPRINAASRMGEPETAFRLLTTEDDDEAEKLAAQLESLNRKRRGAVAGMVKEARGRLKARYTSTDKVIVLGDVEWKPSLCGLAANSIMGEQGGIAILWGRDANGVLKGSARSDGSISVVDLFTQAKDEFIEFGGHRASGGFSISNEKVHTLPERLAVAASEIRVEKVMPRENSDADIPLRQVSTTFLSELGALAPFGVGNPKPIFRVQRIRITFARQFGKEMNHTEITVVCPESGVTHRAFQFFKTPMDFTIPPSPGTNADLLATVERDSFRGPDRLALRLVDIVQMRV